MQGQYDKAYIMPSGQVATIWADGTDELFSDVTQDWKGDKWIYTYNNFDPTASLYWLAQTYCDPNHATDCWVTLAWDPDLPEVYPFMMQNDNYDDIFDYAWDTTCSGARSLSVLVSYNVRFGECGSGIWQNPQDLALEFSLLNEATFRGASMYELPIDASIASFSITGQDGVNAEMPIYGRFTGYVNSDLQMAMPMTPNWEYQARWLNNFVENHGQYMQIDMTYGSLNAQFQINATDAGF